MVVLLWIALFAVLNGIVIFFLLLFYKKATKNSFVQNMIRSGQIEIKFPDPIQCMTELGYYEEGGCHTLESKAALEMYELVKNKFNVKMHIN